VLERLASGAAGRDELLALAGAAPSQHGEEQRVRRMVQLADVLQRLGRLGLVKPLRK
jgi:hypothetical protein